MVEFRGLALYFSYERLIGVFGHRLGILWINEVYRADSNLSKSHFEILEEKYHHYEVFKLNPDDWKRHITYGVFLNV